MTLFACEVPGKPIPQSRPRIWRNGAVGYVKASEAQKRLLVQMYSICGRPREPISEPVSVLVEIAGAHGGTDTDNHGKMVLDALVDARVLAKDSLMVVRELVVRVVGGMPRTAVTITKTEVAA
jgi:Holliday junction resolvase RusA-like endonuclease